VTSSLHPIFQAAFADMARLGLLSETEQQAGTTFPAGAGVASFPSPHPREATPVPLFSTREASEL